VNARATRIALCTASLPVVVNRSRSIDGRWERIRAASASSSGVVEPYTTPRAASVSSSARNGGVCPKSSGPYAMT
jgi:hypothetical protein